LNRKNDFYKYTKKNQAGCENKHCFSKHKTPLRHLAIMGIENFYNRFNQA